MVFTLCLRLYVYACALLEPHILRFRAILKSFCPPCGTYRYDIQRISKFLAQDNDFPAF